MAAEKITSGFLLNDDGLSLHYVLEVGKDHLGIVFDDDSKVEIFAIKDDDGEMKPDIILSGVEVTERIYARQ